MCVCVCVCVCVRGGVEVYFLILKLIHIKFIDGGGK